LKLTDCHYLKWPTVRFTEFQAFYATESIDIFVLEGLVIMPEISDQRDVTPAISDNMKSHYEYFNVRRRKMSLFAGIRDDLRTAKFDASDFQFSAIFRRMFQTLIFSFVAYIGAAIFLVLKFNYQISVFFGFATVFGVCAVFVTKRKKRRFNGREY
jgi:hypothetical protein